MPELPEVETVKRGLEEILTPEVVVDGVRTSGLKLRQEIPVEISHKLKNQKIQRLERRAKYLLFHSSEGILVNHLGMTGSWRLANGPQLEKHDHLQLSLADGRFLTYRDPRRFGFFDWLTESELSRSKRFAHLGPEPLSKDFHAADLYQVFQNRRVPVKGVIMDQKVVVGVGNIYASEALFYAGISPRKLAHRVSRERTEKLVQEIRRVLRRAIRAGGTTISDFRQAGGSTGYFQVSLAVYGRAGESCHVCGSKIRKVVIAQRSSFYCPQCQKG